MKKIIDLRSDTVTRPTSEMKLAMMEAEVGDDVYGEDPTVRLLEKKVATLLGKEAAIFVPSGTMSNQLAIGAHTSLGDEILCDPNYHINLWEGGGPARLWGVSVRTIQGQQGVLNLESLQDKIRPDDFHFPRTKLLCLENTLNRSGGKVYPYTDLEQVTNWARSNNLGTHLDGARLFNAVVASGISADKWAQHFDTVSICLSKGLGAPVGSVLAGSKNLISKALRLRKMMGGGLRQSGFLAAAGIYALDNHIEKLKIDHENAQILTKAFLEKPGFELEFGNVDTNLIWMKVDPKLGTAQEIVLKLKNEGILMSALEKQVIRATTHFDVTKSDIEKVVQFLKVI